MRSFLHLDDLDDDGLGWVLDRARRLEAAPIQSSLRDKVVALLFMNPSLRTLASMQAGIAQLGGTSVVLQPGQGTWTLEWRRGQVMNEGAAEHMQEALPVLEGYADALAIRCFAGGSSLAETLEDPVLRAASALVTKPLINLESATAHPCQSLADWKTMDDLDLPRRGGRFVLSWAWHPRALPLAVPAGTLHMACRRGMEVTLLAPPSHVLPEPMLARARAAAERSGGSLRISADRAEALEGAQVVYAKSWGAPALIGRPEEEAELRRGLEDWCVAESWFDHAAPEARFMHCLPVRRNVVVRDEVLDSARSVVIRQAHNRLHVQKALLELMLGARN
ncbi:MAG: N-acetylornithine carbamoyltransferase [Planctomycetes bacterium]|nr:N-acetylornithine carbamoyltransferase [Planctomycetota bacterium]